MLGDPILLFNAASISDHSTKLQLIECIRVQMVAISTIQLNCNSEMRCDIKHLEA